MLRGLFVTGTDTGVGKTVACAAVMQRYRNRISLRYWKPIQTGIELDDDTAEVQRLGQCRDEDIRMEGIRLPNPVSPHLAARWNGLTIDLRELTAWTQARVVPMGLRQIAERWIVEGAGGALVPVNDSELVTDLMAILKLPVLLVARSTLGTINHTLLTLEALRARALPVAGVVMIGEKNGDNRAAIEHHGKTRVLGEMPRLDPLNAQEVARWATVELDPDEHLWEFLR